MGYIAKRATVEVAFKNGRVLWARLVGNRLAVRGGKQLLELLAKFDLGAEAPM